MTLFADGGGFLLVCGQNLCICIKSLFGPLLLAFHKNDWQKFSPDKCLCLIHSCFLSSSLCTLSILWRVCRYSSLHSINSEPDGFSLTWLKHSPTFHHLIPMALFDPSRSFHSVMDLIKHHSARPPSVSDGSSGQTPHRWHLILLLP